MKKILVGLLITITIATAANAQSQIPALDKSPLDVSYFPANYTLLKIQDKVTEPLVARVIYSRPQKNNRVIFGDLIEFGKLWRMGANEATEVEFFQPVKINNSLVKKGKYTLYCIPNPDKWTIILNKELDIWGSFKYDQKKDVLRMEVPVQIQADTTEFYSMYFEKANNGFLLNAVWDNTKISLPIKL